MRQGGCITHRKETGLKDAQFPESLPTLFFFRSVVIQVPIIAAYLLRKEKLTTVEDCGGILIPNEHLVSRMILNVFPLILGIFTNYFVLGVTENKHFSECR